VHEPDLPRTLSLPKAPQPPLDVASGGPLSIQILPDGSLYMLEIYDRVLPSRSVPTLVGLSLLVIGLYGVRTNAEHGRLQGHAQEPKADDVGPIIAGHIRPSPALS
jgi:hypothetical protein